MKNIETNLSDTHTHTQNKSLLFLERRRQMSELENLKSLEKYDQWKKTKKRRKNYIALIASLIGFLIALLITWLILRVSPKDNWTLTKATFASEDKILGYIPKIEEIDNKLKKSIASKPLNFLSKKVEEDTAKEVSKGNFGAIVSAIRTYSIILIVIWFLVLLLIWWVFYFLARWIISRFIWKEPSLYEQRID
ncbi:hypothetical protein [endosymbiont GvMRE of Glomus versiforme]|uniref:hypothetical protein n=1 Tax=endosymbiont GvMRE of Glomus versiforme TaxID=2039283 RepID=UPI000EBB69CD|nr:hypothetical protein [endosymbiont GvMRE of Glomus versiforme]RHZ36714.1 hypothetical protein GvMRE_I2g383 [endosymbiont GvMRE of Glomus versiforme]